MIFDFFYKLIKSIPFEYLENLEDLKGNDWNSKAFLISNAELNFNSKTTEGSRIGFNFRIYEFI